MEHLYKHSRIEYWIEYLSWIDIEKKLRDYNTLGMKMFIFLNLVSPADMR